MLTFSLWKFGNLMVSAVSRLSLLSLVAAIAEVKVITYLTMNSFTTNECLTNVTLVPAHKIG